MGKIKNIVILFILLLLGGCTHDPFFCIVIDSGFIEIDDVTRPAMTISCADINNDE